MNAAQRMRQLGRRQSSGGAPSSIFGSAAGMAQSIETEDRLRVSVYPFVCQEMPEVAMGLASCFAYLLEQYPSTRAHRVFARMDNDGDSDEIAPQDYQFSPADWSMAGLADNVQMWGELRLGDPITLTLNVDTSLLDGEEGFQYTYEFQDLDHVVEIMPEIVDGLMKELLGQDTAPLINDYMGVEAEGEALELLPLLFDWNLDVYLQLCGVDWAEEDIRDQFNEFAAICKRQDNDFSDWCLAMMAKHVMQAGLEDIGEVIVPLLNDIHDLDGSAGVPGLALGLAELGYHERAAAMLEDCLNENPVELVFYCLAKALLDAGRFHEAVDACQRGLEAGLDDPTLYMQYAQLLITAQTHGWHIEDVLLIDPDEIDEDLHITQEIANALKLHFLNNQESVQGLGMAINYMLDAGDDEMWVYFLRLVLIDEHNLHLTEIVDRMMDLDDYSPAVAILEENARETEWAELCLAQIALENGQRQRAAELIEKGQNLQFHKPHVVLALQRLLLSVELPGFEEDFAEIQMQMNAGAKLPNRSIGLLETACEVAPKLTIMRVRLAQAYESRDEYAEALEVLQDAEAELGSNPRFSLGIVHAYDMLRQHDDAVVKLTTALDEHPNDINLISHLVFRLAVDDQMDDARRVHEHGGSHRPLASPPSDKCATTWRSASPNRTSQAQPAQSDRRCAPAVLPRKPASRRPRSAPPA